MRLDEGGENVSVRKLCDDKGINIELTLPYTPQYNGRIERRFAIITSMAMALLWNARTARSELSNQGLYNK